MKAFGTAVVVTAVLAVGTVWAADDNKAQPRGGSGGSSSSAGSRHHSGGSSARSDSGSSSSDSSSRSGGSSSVSSSSSQRSAPTAAQLRHPRAGTGTGVRRDGDFRRGRSRSYWHDPYWYGGSSWYGGFGYGWYGRPYYGWYSPSYYSGVYGYSPYQHRYGYSSHRAGSMRVLVEPNEARVYVDGYYAGVADDFDGIFQRLHLAPGRHDISLRLDGYRSQKFKVYVPYDTTIKLHHRMQRGTGEGVSEDLMGGPEEYARYEPRGRGEDDDYEYEESGRDRDRDRDQGGERGLLRLDVQPGDASIYVDGAFRGTGRELRQVRLTPGRHRIEVVRPGYRTVEREVDVRRGESVDMDINLDRS